MSLFCFQTVIYIFYWINSNTPKFGFDITILKSKLFFWLTTNVRCIFSRVCYMAQFSFNPRLLSNRLLISVVKRKIKTKFTHETSLECICIYFLFSFNFFITNTTMQRRYILKNLINSTTKRW